MQNRGRGRGREQVRNSGGEVEKEGMEDGTTAAGEEARMRMMIGAGFAKKVVSFFGEHAARVKHLRHVKPTTILPLPA